MAKPTTQKEELEIKALDLYCQAMQIWIDNNSASIKASDSSNPGGPPPPPPGGGH